MTFPSSHAVTWLDGEIDLAALLRCAARRAEIVPYKAGHSLSGLAAGHKTQEARLEAPGLGGLSIN